MSSKDKTDLPEQMQVPQDASEAAVHQGPEARRAAIRDQIFGSKPEKREVTLFGAMVELRQPTLKKSLQLRAGAREEAIYGMMLDYVYVPGTDDRVFDDADIESIGELPMGPDMRSFIDGVNSLLGIDPVDLEKAVKDAAKSD